MKRVLIVEDELSIAEVARDYLEAGGYAAELAQTGKKGLQMALEQDFDLISLDIMLPDMDGFSICREIRKVKQTPIMFVTAKIEDIDKIKGFSAGADDYIIKPFSFNEFIARVGAHISRFENLTQPKGKRNEIAVGDLVIDMPAHKISVRGKEVSLTIKEFDLLSFLAQNPNEVFSKEKLLDQVWGADAFVEINTIAVHVNRLREKIEKNPATPKYVQTVWGVGYKFSL